MTWRGGILRDLADNDIRGLLPKYIAAFLSKRRFTVRVRTSMSSIMTQENGVPQGSILSVTLFAIKINSITKKIPQDDRFLASLYVDDLQIGYRHSDLQVIGARLQALLGELEKWTNENGFRFSALKTTVVMFSLSTRLTPPPSLYLSGSPLPYSDDVRFLGLIWDKKLTWNPHVTSLKAKCSRALNLMRTISGQKWGADQTCLIRVYKLYLRSKLDYGAIVYGSATDRHLNPLDIIVREALRISTGAFRSTPVDSLHSLSGEGTLQERRDYLALRYYFKIRAHLANPSFRAVTNTSNSLIFSNRNLPKPLNLRIQEAKQKYQISLIPVMPLFSYQLLSITRPTDLIPKIPTDLSLSTHPKATTPPELYLQLFSELSEVKYRGYQKIYTDGSKSTAGTGAACFLAGSPRKTSLPPIASIYFAELYAIQLALYLIQDQPHSFYVIFSDSFSSIISLQNHHSHHPLVRKIIHQIDHLRSNGKTIELCWIPSHVGIRGNTEADRLAGAAAVQPEEFIPIYFKDIYPYLKTAFITRRKQLWLRSNQKLRQIKNDTEQWPSICPNRKEEVILNRLRLGHCLFSHQYLMENNGPSIPPICPFCTVEMMTIKHVLIDCSQLNDYRHRYMPSSCSDISSISLCKMLGKSCNCKEVFDYVKAIGLFDEI